MRVQVKNQAQCGSCWAFATTGAVEGVSAITTKQLQSASEQELVDCDHKEDKGCGGGLMDYAYEFIMENGVRALRRLLFAMGASEH